MVDLALEGSATNGVTVCTIPYFFTQQNYQNRTVPQLKVNLQQNKKKITDFFFYYNVCAFLRNSIDKYYDYDIDDDHYDDYEDNDADDADNNI